MEDIESGRGEVGHDKNHQAMKRATCVVVGGAWKSEGLPFGMSDCKSRRAFEIRDLRFEISRAREQPVASLWKACPSMPVTVNHPGQDLY